MLLKSLLLVLTVSIIIPGHLSYFLTPSIFNEFPPTIKFSYPNNASSTDVIPKDIKKWLVWGKSFRKPNYPREYFYSVIKATGFEISSTLRHSNDTWIGQLGGTTVADKGLMKSYRKFDVIPGHSLLDDKNKMAANLNKASSKFPAIFNFSMETYRFPLEANQIKSAMEKHKDCVWIVKPATGYFGEGIFLIKNYTELQQKFSIHRKTAQHERFVVQKYLSNPYLTKHTNRSIDLRVHVLITNILPLRIYTSYEVLVKTGLSAFNLTDTDSCGLIYSKQNREKCKTKMSDVVFYFPQFAKENFNPEEITRMKVEAEDLIIKTITTVLPKWEKLTMRQQFNNYNTFQMFSFDFLLDEKLNLHLVEVNHNPIEHNLGVEYGAGTEYVIHSPLVSRLNIVGYNLPPTIPMEIRKKLCADMEMSDNNEASCIDSIVFNECLYKFPTVEFLAITANSENYTEDALKMLALAENELQRSKSDNIFQRIYPTKDTRKYIKYMDKDTVNYNAAVIIADWEEKYDGKREEAIERLKQMLKAAKICNIF